MEQMIAEPRLETATGTANFQGQCGECSDGYYTATCSGGMLVGQSATVNGNSPQNCVVANDGACVYEITTINNAGPYDYQIRIDAQGPSGPFSGSMHLAFRDATGDVYYIYIYSSTHEWHTISYNSSDPRLTDIYWSDKSFDVAGGDSSRPKPQYQVVSPAS